MARRAVIESLTPPAHDSMSMFRSCTIPRRSAARCAVEGRCGSAAAVSRATRTARRANIHLGVRNTGQPEGRVEALPGAAPAGPLPPAAARDRDAHDPRRRTAPDSRIVMALPGRRTPDSAPSYEVTWGHIPVPGGATTSGDDGTPGKRLRPSQRFSGQICWPGLEVSPDHALLPASQGGIRMTISSFARPSVALRYV